jgi:hypothetical protein
VLVVAVVVAALLVVGVFATADPVERQGQVAGPGGTTPPRAGDRVQRIVLDPDVTVVALATEPGNAGVWALTRVDSATRLGLKVWHYDPASGTSRSWPMDSPKNPFPPDAFAVCGDVAWFAAGGEYGGPVELVGFDTATSAFHHEELPSPVRPNHAGATGIEGPGRVTGITCRGADGSIRMTRAAWTSVWTYDIGAGTFTEQAMPWNRLPEQMVADGDGHLAIASPTFPSPSDLVTVVTITDSHGGPGGDTSSLQAPGQIGLVGTRAGFLIIGSHEIQRVETGEHRAGGTGTAAPNGVDFDVRAGGGILRDGRLVALSGDRLVVLDPTAQGRYRTVAIGRSACRDVAGSLDPGDCWRESPMVAVDDGDHVFVTDPSRHAIDQVGVPERR